MRWPRVRLKIWWLMAAVAVTALTLGGERCWRHYRRCNQAASYHVKQARFYAKEAVAMQKVVGTMYEKMRSNEDEQRRLLAEKLRRLPPVSPTGIPEWDERMKQRMKQLQDSPARFVGTVRKMIAPFEELREKFQRLSAFEQGLQEKYEQAALLPWRAIPADPPAPQ